MEEWADHPCLLAQLLFLFVSEDSSLKGVSNILMLSIREGWSQFPLGTDVQMAPVPRRKTM